MTLVSDQVHRAYEAFTRGETDELLAMLDLEIELHEEPELPDPDVLKGLPAVAAYFSDTAQRWSRFSIEVTDVEEVDDSIVVVRGVMSGAGALSGAEAKATFAHVIELRDGKAIRIRLFFDEQRALQVAETARSSDRLGK